MKAADLQVPFFVCRADNVDCPRVMRYNSLVHSSKEREQYRFDALSDQYMMQSFDTVYWRKSGYKERFLTLVQHELRYNSSIDAHWIPAGSGAVVAAYAELVCSNFLQITIPDRLVCDDPVVLDTLLRQYDIPATMRIVIIVGVGASVSFSLGDSFTKQITRSATIVQQISVRCGEGSAVTWKQYEHSSGSVSCISCLDVIVNDYAHFMYQGSVQSVMYRKQYITVKLAGIGASATVHGGYALQEGEQYSVVVTQYHSAPRTQSKVTFNGALAGSARGVYNGSIYIAPYAAQVSAMQNNKNILLGDRAQAHSIPLLEVLCNDVQCGHGSAVGRFDTDVITYMRSRGLSKKAAERLLLYSFFAEVIADERLTRGMASYVTD